MKKYSLLDLRSDHLFECDLKRDCAPIFNHCYTNTDIINFLEKQGVLKGNFLQKRYTPDDLGMFALHFNAEGESISFIERLNTFLEQQAQLAVPHSIKI